MSINYSDYKKHNTKKVKKNIGYPPSNSMPNEIKNLAKYTDTKDRHYFEYTNEHGATAFYIRRKEASESPNGKKMFVPYSYDEKTQEWIKSSWENNRPLFQANRLKTASTVIIHEGEKAVIHANKILPDYTHTTWSGGSNQVEKTIYETLKDKEVILFPDNDKPGIKAMVQVALILLENDITENIKIVSVDSFPDGFDVADEVYHKEFNIKEFIKNAKEFNPDDYEEEIEAIEKSQNKKQFESKIEKFLEDYIYIRSITSFFETDTKEIVSKIQVNDWNLHLTGGKSLSHELLKNKNLIKVHSVFTHPGIAPGVVNIKPGEHEAIKEGSYYNMYYPTHIKAVPGDVSKILDYYKWFLGEHWETVEQFIAYMIQKPGSKVRWTPTIISPEGGGKGLLAKLISSILGHHNCNTQLMFEQMINQFSNVLLGLQFGIINELDLSSRKNIRSATNSLKKFITDDVLTIELKGKPQIKIPFFANFMIFSNEEDCLHLTKEGRRYFIIKIKHTQDDIISKLESGHKDYILDSLENNSKQLGYLLYHFQNVEIKDEKMFQRNAPRTEDFYEVVESSRPAIHRLLDERLDANQWPFNHNGWLKTIQNLSKDKTRVVSEHYITEMNWCGMIIVSDLYSLIKLDPILGKEFVTLDLITIWAKEKCIKWGNGKTTKQIILPGNTYPRAYLIKNFTYIDGEELISKTEGELGNIYWDHQFHSKNVRLDVISNSKRIDNQKELPGYLEKKPNFNL